ncbi:V-type ATP synthase subunit A [Candidatus Bipolaricaulota bacterium]|nr:V-type ATP synthase subunit A [Candidatus Bipolaricaulota bacterium]
MATKDRERSDVTTRKGLITGINAINGPVVKGSGMAEANVMELVYVSDERLAGEIINIDGDIATIQVYEDTTGLGPGVPIYRTGRPLSVELGPGLIGNVLDGIARPLNLIREKQGVFIGRGVQAETIDRSKKWTFAPQVKVGDAVVPGQVLGTIPETPILEHRIVVPQGVSGKISSIVPEGEYTVTEHVAEIETENGSETVTMLKEWPVRRTHPLQKRMKPSVPLITGQRVIDALFPLAKGGAAAIPGGFGAGKTVLQHQLASWSDADVIIYIGCGERGNEMTDVLNEFPKLKDPRSGRPLMERTILIANTSNMPVTARESSIYTGVTIGEYFRDMGYHVALMADSTSRWAEAVREIAGRLEEMPVEEGFPAYLPARLAEFYERAGYGEVGPERYGSITIIGAVSPPGGDFTEPVTQNTKRFIRTFWALDKRLAFARHFPAISWIDTYSEYIDEMAKWWKEEKKVDWRSLRQRMLSVLSRENELQKIVQIIGPDALPSDQRLILHVASLIKEGFLQQNAMDDIDRYSTPEKEFRMLDLIAKYEDRAEKLVQGGLPIYRIQEMKVNIKLLTMKQEVADDKLEELDAIEQEMNQEFDELEKSLVTSDEKKG